jgi:alpha-D-ribose 1-methylphosphonate 5-triphosphate diphosphatase
MLIQAGSPHATTVRIASEAIVLTDGVISGTVTIEGGQIVRIDDGRLDPRAELWGSDLLIPGLIELHTDHLEPHYSPRPKVFWDPLSAVLAYDAQIATSGITTVFDSLRAGSDGDRHTLAGGVFKLAAALDAARQWRMLRVEHLTHLRCEICSEDVIEETQRFMATHPVHLLSLMDHTPGVRQFRDENKLREYYRGKSSKTETELDTFIAARKVSHARNHDRHRAALIALARAHRVALASHDDTTTEHVAESRADGVRLAEFPTTTEAAIASREAGIAVMMGAPNVVRGGSHSGNVAARDLAERGLLDALSSDYVPASLLHGALMLADIPAIGGLAGAIRLVTKAPAQALGLADRGEIAVGKRADLVRVDVSRDVPVIREVLCAGVRVA